MKRVFTIKIHLLTTLGMLLAGCASFKPVVQNTRYFVLTPAPTDDASVSRSHLSLGLGAVTIPGYLRENRLVVRRGGHEIRYVENLRWAERLDKNIQRVLAANIGQTLGITDIYESSWRRDEVSIEIYVSFGRFEFDENGNAVLEAQWAVTHHKPDAATRSGTSSITRKGASVTADPDAAVASLNGVLDELSREIAAAITADGSR